MATLTVKYSVTEGYIAESNGDKTPPTPYAGADTYVEDGITKTNNLSGGLTSIKEPFDLSSIVSPATVPLTVYIDDAEHIFSLDLSLVGDQGAVTATEIVSAITAADGVITNATVINGRVNIQVVAVDKLFFGSKRSEPLAGILKLGGKWKPIDVLQELSIDLTTEGGESVAINDGIKNVATIRHDEDITGADVSLTAHPNSAQVRALLLGGFVVTDTEKIIRIGEGKHEFSVIAYRGVYPEGGSNAANYEELERIQINHATPGNSPLNISSRTEGAETFTANALQLVEVDTGYRWEVHTTTVATLTEEAAIRAHAAL
jgi:hypothetical protein